jgi:RNA polymerase sigma factor (sigma-70 family)
MDTRRKKRSRGPIPKDREPLTAELQRLAETAWQYVDRRAAEVDRDWRDVGVTAAVAERIVTLIPTFDPAKSSLQTWAQRQAHFAIGDAARAARRPGYRRSSGCPSNISLDAERWMADPSEGHRPVTLHNEIGESDPVPEFEHAEAARHLLRGLRPDERHVVWGHYVEGRTLKDLAADIGVSESRASQIRAEALEFLRAARRTA